MSLCCQITFSKGKPFCRDIFDWKKIRKEKKTREARRSQSETALFEIILAQPQAPVFDSSQRQNVRYLSQMCSELVWPFWSFIPVFWQRKVPSQNKKSLHESRQPLVYFLSHRVNFCDVCDGHSPVLSKTCLGKFLRIVLYFFGCGMQWEPRRLPCFHIWVNIP